MMPVSPDDPPLMIAQWRELASLYRKAGNIEGMERTTRLANQLEQMLFDGTLTFSGPIHFRTRPVPDMRYCRRCINTWPITNFPRDPKGLDGFGKYCMACVDKLPTKSPVNTRPRKKKEPIV